MARTQKQMISPVVAFTSVLSPNHALAVHPESPERFKSFSFLSEDGLKEHLHNINPRQASPVELARVHPELRFAWLKSRQVSS